MSNTFLSDFLFLILNQELSLLRFNLFVILKKYFRNSRLSNSDRDDFNSRSPLIAIVLECTGKHLI